MGTYTEFTGAIRITPHVPEALADRLEKWLEIRHMRRDVSALEKLYPTVEARSSHTLFSDGDFGSEGELFLPDDTRDLSFTLLHEDMLPEGLSERMDVNYPPMNCPSLYSDLVLVRSKDEDCSYLGWNGSEKAYSISEWLRLLASYLVPRGFRLDGRMFAIVEYGTEFYFIHVHDENVVFEEFLPDVTYQEKFSELYDA